MGIHNFQPYIKKEYPESWKNKFNVTYDNLYIDLNYILHNVCYLSKDKNDLLERFKDYLRGIIVRFNPKKRLILVGDGVAPLAKMILQRKRRIAKNNDEENLSLNLTTGTQFMMELESSLYGFIQYIKEKYKIEVLTYITDTDEGEIKIRKHLDRIHESCPNDTHIVYSGDSDMILILFTCANISNIYLALDKNNIIHLGKLYDIHIEKYGNIVNAKNDFVFINLMLGNDYIPKIAYVKINTLWDSYKIVSKNRNSGLVSYSNNTVSIDPIFIHDLLYITSKQILPHFLKRFKLSDIKNKLYSNYIEGINWCFSMYVNGKCSDYRYIYQYKSPHITGMMLSLIRYNTYIVKHSLAIDIELYGILLIPARSNYLLSSNQLMIIDQLIKKHPIIYNEEKNINLNDIDEIYKTFIDIKKKMKKTTNKIILDSNIKYVPRNIITKKLFSSYKTN